MHTPSHISSLLLLSTLLPAAAGAQALGPGATAVLRLPRLSQAQQALRHPEPEVDAAARRALAPAISRLLRGLGVEQAPADWAALGLDPSGPVEAQLYLGRTLALFRARISDPLRVDAALKADGARKLHSHPLAQDTWALELPSGASLSCVEVAIELRCQLGLGDDPSPLAGLRWLSAQPPLPETRPEAPLATLRVDMQRLQRAMSALLDRRLRKQLAFASPAETKALLAEAAQAKAMFRQFSLLAPALRVEVLSGRAGLALTAQLQLSPLGHRLLNAWVPPAAAGEAAARWAQPPGIVRISGRMPTPWLAQLTSRLLGEPVRAAALNGGFSLMVYGFDPNSGAAKADGAKFGPARWAFVFPSALALGVAPGRRQAPALGPLSAGLASYPPSTDLQSTLQPTQVRFGRLKGEPYGVASGAGLVVAAAGLGAPQAAYRRLRAIDRPPAKPAPILGATIGLHALSAALSEGIDARRVDPQLLRFARMHAHMSPWLDRFDRLRLRLAQTPTGVTLSLHLDR